MSNIALVDISQSAFLLINTKCEQTYVSSAYFLKGEDDDNPSNSFALIILLSATSASAEGPGPMHSGKDFQFNKTNTPGWSLMSTEERNKHREKCDLSKIMKNAKPISMSTIRKCKAKRKSKISHCLRLV